MKGFGYLCSTLLAVIIVLFVTLFRLGLCNQQSDGPQQPTHELCQPISISLCKDVGYNQTIMPNILGQDTQENAGYAVNAFLPLIKINCSSELKIFLCSLYIPVCTVIEKAIPPCKSICIAAREGCKDLMGKFGYGWPREMSCEKFPDPPELCVGPPSVGSTTPRPAPENVSKSNKKSHIITNAEPGTYTNAPGKDILLSNYLQTLTQCSVCQQDYVMETKQKYKLKINDDNVLNECGLPCHNVFFEQNQERFARYWVGVWAILCFISTLFTVLTFLIDMQRFRYPERPIIFISGCYLIVSLCYAVGFFLKDQVSCIKSLSGEYVVTQGTNNEGCTILFMLTYFFTMASSIWWVILTLTWVLAAGLKWGHEAIESNSQFFHLAAWAIPAIKTITIIALGYIDGDVLSGVCFTGLSDKTSLIGFVVAPLAVYLLLGTVFLIAGFISLFNIRNVIKHSGSKTNKLEKLMVRIGIFSVLYTVPAIIVIACNVYELVHRTTWLEEYMIDSCPVLATERSGFSAKKPDFTWFIFKYLGYLVVGITSGFWIWSNKTVSSWARLF